MTVSVRDVDWQSSPDNLRSASQAPAPEPCTAGVLKSSTLDPTAMRCGRPDRYKHMEVRIVHGALKGNFGTVVGTHWTEMSKDNADSIEYEEIAVVETETQAVKSRRNYHLGELRERQ